jgi:DNA polymerase-1
MKETLYIMDGHGLIYRAYYAFIRRPLLTAKGENTSAIHGFMRMLIRLLKDESPEYLVCAFDSKKKTFRHELFPDYKAKRLKAPEDLLSQAETIRELVVKLGVPGIAAEGWEADDIIGTLADASKREGVRCVVVSSDKDILQLVDERVTVMASRKGTAEMEVLDAGKVSEAWQVPPGGMTDLLALMGDQSDNVPGVKGIGESGAVKLVREFGSLERLYENLASVGSERIRALLEKGREAAFLSKRLVTIRRDVPLDFRLESFKIAGFPRDEGLAMLAEKELVSVAAELRSLAPGIVGRLPGAAGAKGAVPGTGAPTGVAYGSSSPGGVPPEPKRGVYHLLQTEAEFDGLRKKIAEAGMVSLDTESTGLDPMAADLIGVSLAVREGEGYYIPIRAKSGPAPGADFLGSALKPLLEDKRIKKIGQNIKYDYVLLRKEGIAVKGIAGDTMVASYLLDPQKQRYSLDDMAREFLDYATIRYTDVVKSKEDTLLDVPLADVVNYSGEDSDIALRLHSVLLRKLEEQGAAALYEDIEVPLLVVLGKMEHTGVRIDTGYLARMSVEFGKDIDRLVKKVHELAGEEFNVRSTKQLAEVLFGRMKLPVIKRTKTGISTDESVLEELAATYEIARVLLRHRTLAKLKSTYIDALPLMVNDRTGRVHTSFNQTVATTGRLSSSNPNLQNIPIREEEGRAIRKAFVPEEGWAFLSADYSQIELRILASITGDANLMKAFLSGRDVHRETASLLFGVDVDGVKDHQRAVAKTINYSITYGISPFGLSRRLGIPKNAASELIDMYFQKYSGVAKYFEEVVEKAKEKGYVETLLGRRRSVPEIRSPNKTVFETARRVVLNTPIQGTAADLIKKAMVIIDRELERRRLKSRMLIQVHDELVFESPEEECEELSALVKEKMANAIAFNVPIGVNVSLGKNWEEAH